MAVQVMCGWLLLLVLTTASSCRSWEDPAAAEDASQLKAIYDGRHHFALAYDSQSSLWRFEVCEIRRADDPKHNVCVNAFRDGDGRPLNFGVNRLEGSQISPDTLALLKTQQRLIVEYSDVLNSRGYFGGDGVASMGVAVMKQGKLVLLDVNLLRGPTRFVGKVFSTILIGVGGVILQFLPHQSQHAADLAPKLKNVSASQPFYKPKKWAVVLNNWPAITSQDPEVSVKISSVEDHLEVIALQLNLILYTFIPRPPKDYFISQYCVPQGSGARCFDLQEIIAY